MRAATTRWAAALLLGFLTASPAVAADGKSKLEPLHLYGSAPGALYTVPADKILVIETAHGCADLVDLTLRSGLLLLWTRPPGVTSPNFDPANPWLPLRIEAFPVSTSPRYENTACSAPASARLYVMSGYTLLLDSGWTGTLVPGGATPWVSISGYLVPSAGKTLLP
jgi:hypothetical protein